MRNKDKALKNERQQCEGEAFGKLSACKYQETKKCSCKIEISLKEYGELVKRAMREGSTPEAMVARRIAEMVGEENP